MFPSYIQNFAMIAIACAPRRIRSGIYCWEPVSRKSKYYQASRYSLAKGIGGRAGAFEVMPDNGKLADRHTTRANIFMLSGAFDQYPEPFQ